MDVYEQEIAKIQKILRENPKGMTVTDIALKIKINRNSVAKYLDIMRISGLVEMITFGPAKVFFPSKRVPIMNIINYTSDYILILDSNLKINMINDTFLGFLHMKRKDIISQTIDDKILNIFRANEEISNGINEALKGKTITKEIAIKMKKEEVYCTIKIIPTSFNDGEQGVTIILKDNTDRKAAEIALKQSQENFRTILDKINKKK
jgi:PAS domain-containing protein